ncbi:MAG: GNAT family N-acetyltransferase [Gelidibacter sp.]|nr:GNAT family N-acetyltransferase [Gelidibacter sp.]
MSKKSNIIIKTIASKETYPVRHPVLREGRPIEDCKFEHDDLETTVHLGLYTNKTLVGVATFLLNNNSFFSEKRQYQLRGMAVLKSHQGFGYGDAILKYGEQLLKAKHTSLIWFNAREIAIGFYKKNGYQIIGGSFEITGVGTHYVMYKKL